MDQPFVAFPIPAQMTERTVLRALIAGFSLVVILLGLAGFVAVRGSRKIEDDTAKVVDEQRLMEKLLNDVHAEQNTLAAVMHQLSHAPDSTNRDELLQNLANADRELERIAQSASTTPEAKQWHELEGMVRDFSDSVREAINEGGENASLTNL
ncbi:MAG: MCP four helix bundle domain-containing protein, partial [Acidobacteriota bacterium]